MPGLNSIELISFYTDMCLFLSSHILSVRHPVLRSGQHTQALLHWYSFSCLRGVAESLSAFAHKMFDTIYSRCILHTWISIKIVPEKKDNNNNNDNISDVCWENISINSTSNFNLCDFKFQHQTPTSQDFTLDPCQECCISEHWPSVDIARSEKGGVLMMIRWRWPQQGNHAKGMVTSTHTICIYTDTHIILYYLQMTQDTLEYTPNSTSPKTSKIDIFFYDRSW